MTRLNPDEHLIHDPHGALLSVPELGRATGCEIYVAHRPRPQRYIWHHVLPQVCGGKTVAANLIQLCDSCHYSIHRFMWLLVQGSPLPARAQLAQVRIAEQGVAAAKANGTLDKIPNEGGPE